MLRKTQYKDIEKWRETKRNQKLRYYKKTENAINRHKPWTKADIQKVMDHSIPDTQLSKIIGRSVSAIHNMRRRQKKENG